jgi:hypothetical protein
MESLRKQIASNAETAGYNCGSGKAENGAVAAEATRRPTPKPKAARRCGNVGSTVASNGIFF